MKPLPLFALLVLLAFQTEAGSFPGTYEIVNKNSGMVLEVPGWSTTNGTALDQWHGDGNPNQQWTINSLSNGNYEILNVNSGLALEVYNQSTNQGAEVDQWGWWGGPSQQWSIASQSNGSYSIINARSGQALEISDFSTADGGAVDQWGWWTGPNQEWLILPVEAKTTVSPASGGSGTAASTFHGFNWADPNDNFDDGPLLLSGMSITNTYTNVEAEADVVASAFVNVGANTIRIPINPETVIGTWWAAYRGAIDQATSQGVKVILGYWEAESSEDGLVDDQTTFNAMWDTVVTAYNGNPDVYFEIMNEPHGYSTAGWLNVVSAWLTRYPTVAHGRVLVGGTGYCANIPAVATSSITSGCLYSVHAYGFWNSSDTSDTSWYSSLASEVGAYSGSTVMTEYGASMTYGWNYAGGDQGNNGIASMIGFANFACNNGMGSLYWAGLRDGDSYSLFTRNAGTTALTANSASGLDLVKHAWSAFNGAGSYQIVNGNSGSALEIAGWSTANNAVADQWVFDGGANQIWTINSLGNGYYTIVNQNSGLCLGVAGPSTSNGAIVNQYAYYGNASQSWQILNQGSGFYSIINGYSGLALEVAGWSVANGATIDQWQYDGGANQLWTFGPASPDW